MAGTPFAHRKPVTPQQHKRIAGVGSTRRDGAKVRPPSRDTASTSACPSGQIAYTVPSDPAAAWNPRTAPCAAPRGTPGWVLITIGRAHVFPSSIERENRISLLSSEKRV